MRRSCYRVYRGSIETIGVPIEACWVHFGVQMMVFDEKMTPGRVLGGFRPYSDP